MLVMILQTLSFRPHQVRCPYLVGWRRRLNPVSWYATAQSYKEQGKE